jgi:hypothetical protein
VPSVSTQSRSSAMWPFVVGRGRTVPQRVILAPGFLVESECDYLLLRATGECPDPESVTPVTLSRKVIDDRIGEFTVVFRLARADPELVGQHGDFLLDAGSRPIYLAEGMILREDIPVSGAAFQRAHAAAMNAFRDFWHADDRSAGPRYSEPLRLDKLTAGEPALALSVFPPIDHRESAPGTAPVPPGERRAENRIRPVPVTLAGRATQEQNGSQRESGQVTDSGRWARIILVLAAVVVLLAAFAIYKLTSSTGSARSAQPTQLVNSFCSALTSDNPASAYALTTPAFDETMSEPRFAATLLNSDGAARSCTPSTGSSSGAATVAITTSRGTRTWVLTLVTYDGELRISRIQAS